MLLLDSNEIKYNQHTLVHLQTVFSPQSPEADQQEPLSSTEETAKNLHHPRGQCSREVQVPPTPTANHNQEEVSEEDAFGNGRMYLSGQTPAASVTTFPFLLDFCYFSYSQHILTVTHTPSLLPCAEVLESFMATREAMQVQQNVTVYESFGTSSMESLVSPEREPDPRQQWHNQGESEQSLSFPAACHSAVAQCLFLLLGVRPAWVESSERESNQAACPSATR